MDPLVFEVLDRFGSRLEKTAADQSDVAQAQITQMKLQANPLTQVAAQLALKQPDPGLMQANQALTQLLLKTVQEASDYGTPINNPLRTENENLKLIVENKTLKMQAKQLAQQENEALVGQATGGMGGGAGGAEGMGGGAGGQEDMAAALGGGGGGGGNEALLAAALGGAPGAGGAEGGLPMA